MRTARKVVGRKKAYFPHIDGLRALAVISVILFHLEFALFKGGFVGVDVFFVISGYLITAHIRQAVNEKRFSFSDFYIRRAKRLFPALFVTLLLTLLAGWYVLPAANYERLSTETLYTVFSLSNFLFWGESGYFDGASTLKPLLHTWSLSVEEQFYLFWPLLLCFVKKERVALLFLITAGVMSFLAAELIIRDKPAMVFYLMPFRIFEFAIGGVLIWFKGRLQLRAYAQEALCLLGLIAVVLPVFFYSQATVFPGVTALVPCFGAALIILFGERAYTGLCLRLRGVVYVGLISYSLYLVHWPIIVLYRYGMHSFYLQEKLLLALASLLLAVLMYHFVETPFRQRGPRNLFSVRYPTVALVGMFVFLLGLSYGAIQYNGWPARFDYKQLTAKQVEQGKTDRFQLIKANCRKRGWDVCNVPSKDISNNVLILGDSHGADALNILQLAYPDKFYIMRDLGGCPPTVGDTLKQLKGEWSGFLECQKLNHERLNPEFLSQFGTIVIAVFWGVYTPEHLLQTIDYLQQNTRSDLVVFGNYLALNRPMPDLYNQQVDPRLTPDVVRNFALFDSQLQELSVDRYRYISKRALLCEGDALVLCRALFGSVPFSYDEHHMSFPAAEYAAGKLQILHPSWDEFIAKQ